MEAEKPQVSIDAKQSELITELAKNPYFLFMVEREVQERTRSQLSWWWKFLGGVFAVMIGTFSFAGYREFSHLTAYASEKQADLDRQIDTVNKTAEEARETLAGLQSTLENTQKEANKNLGDSKTLVGDVTKLVSAAKEDSRTMLADGERGIEGLVDRLFKRYEQSQAEFEKENRATLAENRQTTTAAQQFIDNGRMLLESVQKESNEFAQSSEKAVQRLNEIERRGEQLRRLDTLEVSLKRAKTFSFLMLESNQSKVVTVPDPLVAGSMIRMKFSTKALKERFDLRIDVDGFSENQQEENLIGGDVRTINVLQNNGLAFEVVAVRHRRLAYDFVMLRIYFTDADGERAIAVR